MRTFTSDLYRLADRLVQCGVKTIAMESIGVYWIPVYEILEARGLEVVLVARHLRDVRGRKSDVSDCEWLRDLHSVGLLSPSFRPADEIVALRSYTRQRERLVQEAATPIQRMPKAPNNKISGGRLLSSKTQPSANRAAPSCAAAL